jgi:hypothetical protein
MRKKECGENKDERGRKKMSFLAAGECQFERGLAES